MSKSKISGFKKFTDLKHKEDLGEANLGIEPMKDSDLPGNPNLPKKTEKTEKPISQKGNMPVGDAVNEGDKNVKLFGKVAKFPNKTKASKAYNFWKMLKYQRILFGIS